MEDKTFLAVDLGATSGRTVLATYDGSRITMREFTRFENPMIPVGKHLFWDIAGLYLEVLKALRQVAREGLHIHSLGIDTWGVDFACFAADGTLLGMPYCYRDAHTEGAPEEFYRQLPAEELYGRTGIQIMDFNTLFQLYRLHGHDAVALREADKLLFMPDALSYMLTGVPVTERTVASTSQLLRAGGAFDPLLLDRVGVRASQLAPLVEPGTVVGRITQAVQVYTGLTDVPVVAVAGHDTASAVLSVPAQDAHYAYLSCGTWSLLGVETGQPVISERSFTYNFTNEAGIDGTTRFLKNICGLWLFERCRAEWHDVPTDVNALNALCELSTYDGLIYPDAPCFAHPSSMTAAITDYCRRSGQPVPQAPSDYVRCIFRSLALRYRQVTGMLQELTGVEVRRIHAIGGGSLNAHLMQYAANATGVEVVCGPAEGTALGNVLMQLRAMGALDSRDAMRRVAVSSVQTVRYTPCGSEEWEEAYTRFLSLPISL